MLKSITTEPIIFLYSVVYMVNLSILPQLVIKKVCLERLNGNIILCKEEDVVTPEMKRVFIEIIFTILQ